MFLILEEDTHLLGETSVGEHSNLRGDVTPVSWCAQLLQLLSQTLSHGDDAR